MECKWHISDIQWQHVFFTGMLLWYTLRGESHPFPSIFLRKNLGKAVHAHWVPCPHACKNPWECGTSGRGISRFSVRNREKASWELCNSDSIMGRTGRPVSVSCCAGRVTERFFMRFQWVLWSHAVFAYWIKRRWLLSSSWEGLRDRTYCISLHFVCFDIKILSLCV